MKHKYQPQMGKGFDAAHNGIICVGRMQHQFAAGFRNKAGLAGNGKFLFIRRLDKSKRREVKRLVHGQNNNLWQLCDGHYPVPARKQQGIAAADAEVLALGSLGV